jgi:hypothetical protein
MTSMASPESSVHAVGDDAKINSSPKADAAAANAVPSREGLAQIRSSEAQNAAAVKGLPATEVTPAPAPLSELGKIEEVVAGAGAVVGAVIGGAGGRFLGQGADLFVQASGNAGPGSFGMADGMTAIGGGIGSVVGAAEGGAVGALVWLGYEIVKPQPAY